MNHGSSALSQVAVWVGLAVGLAGWAIPATDAAAAPNCRKGIPCGNSCIAANRTCRKGSPSTAPAARPSQPKATPSPASPRSTPPASSAAAQKSAAATPGAPPGKQDSKKGAEQWPASKADRVYFRAGCPASLDIAPTNRQVFASEQAAKAAGFRRSSAPGC